MLKDPKAYYRVLGIRRYHISIGPKNDAEVFTVSRRIFDIRGNSLGVIVLNTNSETIYNIINSGTEENGALLYLLNDQGKLICKTDNVARDALLENGEFNTKDFVIASVKGSQTNWIVTVATPVSHLSSTVQSRLIPLFEMMGIVLVFAVLLYALLTYTITQPINRLSSGMKQVGKGNFDVVVEPGMMDEIGELTARFNKMTAHIKHLLGRMVEMEVREKESEYLVLQSQINPHFLYNTLEAIRMRCIVNKEKEIADVINSLSNLFRMSISRRERFVPLRDEIEHVKSYVAVQNFRFDNKYQLTIHADEYLLDYKTFKLMLQPLVENCVFHGLEVKPEDGHIDISVSKEDEYLIIEVKDDGIGISPDKLRNLRAALDNPKGDSDKMGLGLRTVNDRIRLFFGEMCGLNIESEENKGTHIIIRMPAFTDEKEVNINV